MSVTFTTDMSDVSGYLVTCGCDDATEPEFSTYAEAENYLIPLVEGGSLRTPLPGCSDLDLCLGYRLFIRPLEIDPAPSINVNNGNAAGLFRALGLLADNPADLAAGSGAFDGIGVVAAPMADDSPWNGGWLSPADFLGRVLLALAITPADEGRFAVETVGAGGGVTIECSRPVGYLQDRLTELITLRSSPSPVAGRRFSGADRPARHALLPAHIPVMSNVISRAPAGIPTGGQFSRHSHVDGPDDMLDDATGPPTTEASAALDPQQAAEDAEILTVQRIARSVRSQWPDSEHAFARVNDDGTITLTHVYDAFDGLHATEADLNASPGGGTGISGTAGIMATGEWTTNVAKRQVYGGPPNQKSLHIDLYGAAAMPTGPERRLDRARDDISGHVLAQHPDADSWEVEFEYDPATEGFVLADEIYVSSGKVFARVNMRREDPGMLDRLNTATHQALPRVSDETSLQVTIPGPDATWDGYFF